MVGGVGYLARRLSERQPSQPPLRCQCQAEAFKKNRMSNPYCELFAVPGARDFALAGLLARLPLPMAAIGIITMLSQLRGGYALAGAVSATFVLTYALLSPQISRLVDRHGQSCVLPVATVISVIGFLLLVERAQWQGADGGLFAGAMLAGCMPSMSAMVRARCTVLYRGRSRLQTAYSLETVFDEVAFIAGPALSVGACVALFPQAGPLAAALLLLLGVFALLTQRESEPHVEAQYVARNRSGSVIRLANMRLLTLLTVAMGAIVGSVDIVSVAFSAHMGRPAAAGLVLSAYAAASCLAGLLFGALSRQMPWQRQLLLGGLATVMTTLPLLLVDSIAALVGTVLVAGLCFAPIMIVAMSLVERLLPRRSLTEGMTWLLSGLNVGVALGITVAGQVVDASGPQAGFTVALCAAAVLLLVALWGQQRLREQAAAEASVW